MPSPADAENMPLCHAVSLKGPEHTRNPFAPKAKQVQDKAEVCDFVIVTEGKKKTIEPMQQPLIVPPAPPHIA